MTYSPFRDSTEILNSGDSLSERLTEDGYLFIRGLIPRNDVLQVRSGLLNIANEYGWFDKNSPVTEGVANTSLDATTLRSATMAAVNRMWCDEEVHRLRIHPNVLSLFERIFKEPALTHPKFTLRHFFPNLSPTDSHQDHVHVGGVKFCSMWVPLGDCPVDQGVLAIASKSHKEGVLKAKFAGMGIIDHPSWEWVTGTVNAGDVLIFTNTTVHKSLPNLTNKIRLSFDGRYQPASLPIANVSVIPAADSGCVEWEDVYKNWSSTSGQYYWKQFNLEVMGLDAMHYEVDYPVAFGRAKAGDNAMRDMLLRLI
ncbi:MAG: phytanoyl-CoA dioxygenase family protein [Sheuella sp.]|nr:phytanoyl-CoA dioxygenase family protein [Sheuella sp.]